jgi:hypothetical protein
MPQALFLLIIPCFLFGQSTSDDLKKSPQPYTAPEAYEVYSAAIPETWPIRVAHAKALAIYSSTIPFDSPVESCVGTGGTHGRETDLALANYRKMNASKWALQRIFPIQISYSLTANNDLPFQQDRRHGGLIRVSAVGFNPDKTFAVVSVGHLCGKNCLGGTFFIMQKKDGKWSSVPNVTRGCGNES